MSAEPTPAPPVETPIDEIPEMIQKAQAAFRRDLPELLRNKRLRGQWVAYHGENRVGLGKAKALLCQECLKKGIDDHELYVRIILPSSQHEPEWEILSPEVSDLE